MRRTSESRWKRSDEGRARVKAEEEQARNYQMGWEPGSKMGERYNYRHTVRKAHEASLALQADLSRTKKNDGRGPQTKATRHGARPPG